MSRQSILTAVAHLSCGWFDRASIIAALGKMGLLAIALSSGRLQQEYFQRSDLVDCVLLSLYSIVIPEALRRICDENYFPLYTNKSWRNAQVFLPLCPVNSWNASSWGLGVVEVWSHILSWRNFRTMVPKFAKLLISIKFVTWSNASSYQRTRRQRPIFRDFTH